MGDLVIKVDYGGLGDHLFHSHLPRIAKETGIYKRVFFSLQSMARSPEIIDLIWKPNPYLDGFVNKSGMQLSPPLRLKDGNLLDEVMLRHGIDDGVRFHEPEIFDDIEIRGEYSGLVVYDPNYISFVGAIDSALISNYLSKHSLPDIRQMELRKRNYPLALPVNTVRAGNLREYCQIVKSCRQFYCLASGSATIAAALRKPSTVFYGFGQDPIFHHSRLHRYTLASSNGLAARAKAGLLRLRRLFPE